MNNTERIQANNEELRECLAIANELPNAEGSGGDGFTVFKTETPSKTNTIDDLAQVMISYPNATSIGDDAFYMCNSLTSIDLPNATSIGDAAFRECTALTSINIPSVTSIEFQGFGLCTSLTSIDLPSVTSIGNEAFWVCTALTSINLPSVISIGDWAFTECTALTSIDLPKATSIGDEAFYDCTSLDTLILSNTETVCGLNVTAILGTKIATEYGEPTGEGFIYVPEVFYEAYVNLIAEQVYMLLVYSGYSEEEAEYMAPYIAMAVLRTIEGGAQATTFGLRNPLANFNGFTKEAIERFKESYKTK